MLKPNQSLNVNNSNNQAGIVHQTDYKTRKEKLKEAIRKAVELQHKLNELSNFLFVDGDFDKEFLDASERLQSLIHNDLSPMLGYLFINEECKRLEEAV